MRPSRDIFVNNRFYLISMARYYNHERVVIVPSELKHYTRDMGTPLTGSDHCRIYNGHIVSSQPSDAQYPGCSVGYNGHREYTSAYHAIFTGADGLTYDYIIPYRSLVSSFMGEPDYFCIDYGSIQKD